MAAVSGRTARTWADFLALLIGVSLIGISIWPGPPSATSDALRELRHADTLWLVHAGAGSATLVALALAQTARWRGLGRVLLAVAALTLLAALIVFRDFSTRAVLTLVLPALILLACVFAIGPVPPERVKRA